MINLRNRVRKSIDTHVETTWDFVLPAFKTPEYSRLESYMIDVYRYM